MLSPRLAAKPTILKWAFLQARLTNVQSLQTNGHAFAAIRGDGREAWACMRWDIPVLHDPSTFTPWVHGILLYEGHADFAYQQYFKGWGLRSGVEGSGFGLQGLGVRVYGGYVWCLWNPDKALNSVA